MGGNIEKYYLYKIQTITGESLTMYSTLKRVLLATIFLSANAFASFLPFGLQSDLSQSDIDNWGWTECHRSGGYDNTSTKGVLDACGTGSHMMMALWDASEGVYAIAGAGEFDIVTGITYASYSSSYSADNDDIVNGALDNWSNGLNWYRTSGHGSWGFTTADVVDLSSADVALSNGIGYREAAAGGEAASGLSYHLHANGGGDLSPGWGFNVTGNDFEFVTRSDSRVFFVANIDPNDIPEPATLGLLALGLLGVRRFRKG
ncbi:PEP-CTERM sorting domain-containing protein [Colwellia sp. MEBiC06753]